MGTEWRRRRIREELGRVWEEKTRRGRVGMSCSIDLVLFRTIYMG
jgi:hypothetical protein